MRSGTLAAGPAPRSARRQTEDARFWLMTGAQSYYPVVRRVVAAKKMNSIDSARFTALVSVAAADAYIAVFDAKYHYNFWASGHRDPEWRHRQQPCHRTRRDLAADRQYADASGISVCALHHQRRRRDDRRDSVGECRYAGVVMTSPHRAQRHAPLDQRMGLCGRGVAGPHLCRIPLPVFHPGRTGHGAQDRPTGRAERHAAGHCGGNALTNLAGPAELRVRHTDYRAQSDARHTAEETMKKFAAVLTLVGGIYAVSVPTTFAQHTGAHVMIAPSELTWTDLPDRPA